MSAQIRVGTSGWVYPHWRGLFYPADLPQRGWFEFYAAHFDTVEVNNTFYRLPEPLTFERWREQAPSGFLYALKASRFLTHVKRLKDPEQPLQTFLDRAALLGDELGPLLYQLPPNWELNLDRLEAFLALLPPGGCHVLEFRNASWMVEDVYRLMERYGVAHCIHDMQPLQVPLRVTSSTAYVRFHGDAYHGGGYDRETLAPWARRMLGWQSGGLDVFAYFNNDAGGMAVRNARTLKELLGQANSDDSVG